MISMRRLATLFILLLIACRAMSFPPQVTPYRSLAEPSPTHTLSPTPFPFVTFSPTLVPRSTLASTSTAVLSVNAPTLSPNTSFSVHFHPDGPLYMGDLVSLEVISPPNIDMEGRSVRVEFDAFQETKPAEAKFGRYGIGGRSQATLQWIWDTSGLKVGEHILTFSIQPGGPTWREMVFLSPRGQVPPPEPYARWASTESDCCLVYYIKATSVERDLSSLLAVLNQQAGEAIQQMATDRAESSTLNQPVTVTFLPRVLGHGGFASQGISVSYLDRNYTGGDLTTILHHEIVHILDSRLGGEMRPTFLMEGLAVYLSDGHFKPEPLMPRAAALLPAVAGCVPWIPQGARIPSTEETVGCGLDHYTNFSSLVDNFYFEQHEIGYLEAGALVEFMVETWGWRAFSDFYRDIHAHPDLPDGFQEKGGDQYQAMNAALATHFGINLEQLEQRFLHALSREKLTPAHSEDVRLTMVFYDAVRRYQQLLDPSAYFLTAWLPDMEQMRQRGIVADYLRRPVKVENLALESMFVVANSNLLSGHYDLAAKALDAINDVLDAYPNVGIQAFARSSLAADYLALVAAVLAEGFTPEKIQIEGETARIWASKSGLTLSELAYTRYQDSWIFKGEVEAQSGGLDFFEQLSYGQAHSQPSNESNGGSQYKSSLSN